MGILSAVKCPPGSEAFEICKMQNMPGSINAKGPLRNARDLSTRETEKREMSDFFFNNQIQVQMSFILDSVNVFLDLIDLEMKLEVRQLVTWSPDTL